MPMAALAILAGGAVVAPAARAESLHELLRALASGGTEVLYSTDLIPGDPQESTHAPHDDLLARVRTLLAQLDLQLRALDAHRYVVVGGPKATAPTGVNTRAALAGLDEITVFASRYLLPENHFSRSLTREDLQRTPGTEDDAMRGVQDVPGIASNLSSRPNIRGSRADDVLYRFDGVPLLDPFHLRDFQSLMGAVAPEAVQGIDVYTGGFPVQFAGRSAGVLDITPRAVSAGHEERLSASRLMYTAATVGHNTAADLDWLATARRSSPDMLLVPLDAETGNPALYDVLARLRGAVSASSALSIGALLLGDRISVGSDQHSTRVTAQAQDTYAWLGWDWTPAGSLHASTRVSFIRLQRQRQGDEAALGIELGRLRTRHDIRGVHLQSIWTAAASSGAALLWGMEADHERAQLTDERSRVVAPDVAQLFGIRTSDRTLYASEPALWSGAAFLEAQRAWARLELRAGLRVDYQRYQPGYAAAQLSPRLNVRFDLGDGWHAYASLGRYVQAQRPDEWRVEEGQSVADPAGSAVHLIAGALRGTSRGELRLELYRLMSTRVSPYYDNLFDSVELLAEIEADRVRIAPGSALSQGIEASGWLALNPELRLSGFYVLSRASDRIGGRNVPRSWDQTHAARLGLDWHHRSTEVALQATWHTGWPVTPIQFQAGPPVSAVLAARNSARRGAFVSLDLRLSHAIPLGAAGSLVLSLDATNLTDARNACCTALEPGSLATGSLGTGFWLPRLVNVGATWVFDRRR
ncbi:MAG: TonB-dependent receptor [Proteobacteria bacterium]|nr:TonB-dependent receptor [Pseudomonadota bacterium]